MFSVGSCGFCAQWLRFSIDFCLVALVLSMESSLADLRLDDEDKREENEGWRVEEDVFESEIVSDLTLLGYFLTLKTVNFFSMKTTLANLAPTW